MNSNSWRQEMGRRRKTEVVEIEVVPQKELPPPDPHLTKLAKMVLASASKTLQKYQKITAEHKKRTTVMELGFKVAGPITCFQDIGSDEKLATAIMERLAGKIEKEKWMLFLETHEILLIPALGELYPYFTLFVKEISSQGPS